MSSTAFSSDGVEVISRRIASSFPVEGQSDRRSEKELRRYYEVTRCVDFIKSDPKFERVALQFPDCLLCDAATVATLLEQEAGRSVFILGDTSYGSCCVDEIAAEHIQASCIIHFGQACLTQTRRLPVLYVFGREAIDTAECVAAFRRLFPEKDAHILVLYDTLFSHCIDEFRDLLGAEYPNTVISQLVIPEPVAPQPGTEPLPTSPSQATGGTVSGSCTCACSGSHHCVTDKRTETTQGNDGSSLLLDQEPRFEDPVRDICKGENVLETHQQFTEVSSNVDTERNRQREPEPGSHSYRRFGRLFELVKPVEEHRVFYVGIEGPTLTNLMLNYNKCQFYSYNPFTRVSRRETLNVNKALGRRYFLVQKAKEARTVGVLVGTLGAAKYLDIIERLKRILKQAGKKYYTIAVGKLNAPKMANFMEVDVFVLVACPENNLVDSQDFFKPVVTPYEMEVACLRSREWSGDYVTDYRELFPGAAFHAPIEEDSKAELEPEFSLITGGFLRSAQEGDVDQGMTTSAVVPRSRMEVVLPSAAAEYLESRSWRGLEQQLGKGEVGRAVEGRTGTAAAYSHEHYNNST